MIGKGALRIERVSNFNYSKILRDGWFVISCIYVTKKCAKKKENH